ncbi:MAG: hypothetical protein D6732_03090 [Methanobacteriota archaeon]|nr:MAG: hypothetical protein D6732_03090 [Euryarchaeota archaeon]
MKLENKILVAGLAFLVIMSGFVFLYLEENDDILQGKADFQLQYSYVVKNEGSLNLTRVSIRLALLKSWEPVQEVKGIQISVPPNFTTTDEYNNSFIQYDFTDFQVNQTFKVTIKANVTLNLLDYVNANLKIFPYDENDPLYKLFMAYNPLEDTTDPAVQSVAGTFPDSDNPLDIAYLSYNFSSTYIRYKLLSQIRGASFALRNGYGDCDEYTTLFIALSRARGIPAIEHTAWLADFATGFNGTDDGAAAHAYPMFYVKGVGMLPADPTRGNTNFFDNWLKTDEKRITLTRGPDKPYRHLSYRWIPKANISDPTVFNEYRIVVNSLEISYFSKTRSAVFIVLNAIPVLFVVYSTLAGRRAYLAKQAKLRKILMEDIIE